MPDKNAAILESLKQMGYRADQRMWKYLADHSGEAFDWIMELAPDAVVIPENALSYDREKIILQTTHFPTPPGYEPAEEYSPSYPSVICVLPDLGKILGRVYNRCLDNGCTFVFATWARQLIRPGNQGVVKGVICEDETGNVLDRDHNGIEGLYAAGNTMGGRFLVDYPIVTAGASHGFALIYNHLFGYFLIYNIITFIGCFLLLIIPVTCMGATFGTVHVKPFLSQVTFRSPHLPSK